MNAARRAIFAWVTYDWANSAFSTTIMAGFFPIFFKQYWSVGADSALSTMRLGTANSVASLAVALVAPLLGAVADAGGTRRKFLLLFSGMGVAMTAALYFVAAGAYVHATFVYVMATLGFSGANVFYDALLVTVATDGNEDRVSARGFAFGYLGGGLLFAVNVWMTLQPERFGLENATQAVRLSFLSVAVWWAVFTIPLALWVRDVPRDPSTRHTSWRSGLMQLAETFRHLRQLRPAMIFLLAYWFYIDGVHTIVRMAVDYGLSIGFSSDSLIAALLLVQFVGFPASLAFVPLSTRVGPRGAILVALATYLAICIWAARMTAAWEFYVLAAGIGLVQGGVNSLSRSLFATLVPRGDAAQFFGFYNMTGRFSAVIGPLLMGWVVIATGSHRASILAVSSLFLIGGAILLRMPAPVRRPADR